MTIRTTKELRLRRGTTSEHGNFIGAPGEVTVDTDLNTIRVHDGVTPAGHLVRGTGTNIVAWNDVINKPTIPDAQIQSDWTQTNNTLKDFIKNKPDLSQLVSTTQLNTAQAGTLQTITTGLALKANIANLATVATSGSYADLTGKPSIPVVPTTVSSFVNDAGYLTSIGAISYNDLSNKPSLFSGSYADLSNTPTLFSGAYADLTGAPLLFSGSYADLIDQPIIPSIIGLATENYVGVAVANLVNNSPATLDTLNELATALGNDVNFSTTVATALGNRLRVDTDTQNLDATQQSNAITNLGLATVATSAMTRDLTWSVYSTEEDLPNATSVHGMFAHVHSTGHGYMAHAGNWIKLANYSNIPADISELSDTTSLLGSGNKLVNGNREVVLDSNGNLTLPNGGYIYGGTNAVSINGSDYAQLESSGNYIWVENGEAHIQIGNNDWKFGNDGTLTLPNGTTIDDKKDNLIKGPSVNSFGSNSYTGTFTSLNFTGLGTTWVVNGPGIVNGVIQSIDAVGKIIILDRNSGGPQFQNGQSYTFTGPPVSIGSKITVNNNEWTFGTNGNLTAPGNLQVDGGKIVLHPYGNAYVESVDYGVNSANSAVNIFAGPNQKIKLRAGFGTEATWTFGTDGKLTLPSGGDILDSTGTSVLFSGDYTDLTGKPTLFTANQTLNTSDSVSFNRLAVTGASGIEGGEIELAKAPSSTLAGNVIIDVYGDKLRFFEGGGNGRGFYLDLTTGANNTSTNIMSGGGGTGPQGEPGAAGAPGTPGADGADGAPGQGVPTGGTVGQVLAKIDSTDYSTEWVTPAGGSGATSLSALTDVALEEPSQGQVLTWNNNQSKWENQGLPTASEIINASPEGSIYSVSVGTDGVVTMTTARGGIEFGAMPEPGGPTHFHIMRPAGQNSSTDLYFGDDYNYVKMPGLYGSSQQWQQGVEIGASVNEGAVSVWKFGADGDLVLPAGKTIRDTSGTDLLADVDTYKGFRAHYGTMYNNTDDNNGPINKLVIYKSTVTPSSAIDTDTSSDDFQVTGLTGSDVVAMLVVVANGSDWDIQTPTATLKTFVEKIIDEVILDEGVEGDVNTVSAMKSAFYNNFSNFNTIIPNVKVDFEFFTATHLFSISPAFVTGDGSTFSGIRYNMSNDTLDLGDWGQGLPNTHEVGDVHVIPGNTIRDADNNFLVTPDNNVTVTITGVSDGSIQSYTVTGTLPRPAEIWPSTSISDGGDDEYDGANAIHTNLATEISYRGGNVYIEADEFNSAGTATYVVTYQAGIFGIFATGCDISTIGTSGDSGGYGNDSNSSGFDGDGIAVTGSLYSDGAPAVDYNDLTNKPTLFSGSYTDLTSKPALFSGSYTDLTDKPTIPTSFSSLVNGVHTASLGSTGTLTLPGVLTLPQGTTISDATNIVTVTLDQFTAGGFTGTQVFTKVSDTLYQALPSGPTMELVVGIWRLRFNTATYYDSTDLITWAPTEAGSLPAPVGTLTTVVGMGLTVDGYEWLLDDDGNLTLPAGGTISEVGGLTGAIRLTPAGGANEYQALVIYPTAAIDGDHVHLTAGGGTTELYLGNDNHYVKLVDGGNVEVQASTGVLSATAAWTFDTDGNIDTRKALGIKVPDGVPSSVTALNYTSGQWNQNPLSNLATTGGSGSGLTVNVTVTSEYASAIAIATAGTGYLNGEIITVVSGTSTAEFTIGIAGRNTWLLDDDGNLTTPSSLVIGSRPGGGSHIQQNDAALEIVGEGANSAVVIGWTANASAPDSVATIAMNLQGGGEGNIVIAVGNNATTVNYWLFDNTGNLRLPAGGDIVDSTGTSVLGGGTTLPANASGYLINDGAGNLSWAAGDGTFSGNYNDLTNKPTLFDGAYSSLTGTPALFSGVYADLTSKPTLFDGNYNSLTNKPTYKEAVTTGTGPGGNNQADSLVLAGLNPTENIPSTYGGDLILKGGYGGANNDLFGEVRIKSGTIGSNFEWHFTVDKKIKLPAGGSIVDSTGTSVLFSGSYADLTNKPTIPTDVSDLTDTTSLLSSGGKIGYASGSTVTQTSNRGNGVAINALSGTIVTVNASMTAGEIGAFPVTNNQVNANSDIVLVQVVSPNLGNYNVIANPNSGIGGFYLILQNISGFPISAEAVTIRFIVIKAPSA